jgi:dihydrofolate reductase / thymidylate synthase
MLSSWDGKHMRSEYDWFLIITPLQAIPQRFRPLANRLNVVLTNNPDYSVPNGVLVSSSFQDALQQLDSPERSSSIDKIHVIGGESLFRESLAHERCQRIILTSILTEISDCDTFFPVIPADQFHLTYRSALRIENEIHYRFTEYERLPSDDEVGLHPSCLSCNPEEDQYLLAIKDILNTGVVRSDRTGTGTISKFGLTMRFNLRNNVFPLLTTKKVFWRGVAEELLWFLKGSTNANELSEKGIHIWDGNASREYLDSRGLVDREVGDLGPVYGFQWRHFGAQYVNMRTDYAGQGIDQLAQCIETIKSNPSDRRILLTAWNPTDLSAMALPPCHMFCQFYVSNNELSCQLYQRSADMGLGVPFNIASYALLTRLVARVCHLEVGELIHVIGDAHCYLNHLEPLREQIQRVPREFPTLRIETTTANADNIDGFQFSDFILENYNPDGALKMKMAV